MVSTSANQSTGGTLSLRLCDICESSSGSDASISNSSSHTSSSSLCDCAGEGCQTNKTANPQVCPSPHLHTTSRTALGSQRVVLEEREGVSTSPLPQTRAPQSQPKHDACSSPKGPDTNNTQEGGLRPFSKGKPGMSGTPELRPFSKGKPGGQRPCPFSKGRATSSSSQVPVSSAVQQNHRTAEGGDCLRVGDVYRVILPLRPVLSPPMSSLMPFKLIKIRLRNPQGCPRLLRVPLRLL